MYRNSAEASSGEEKAEDADEEEEAEGEVSEEQGEEASEEQTEDEDVGGYNYNLRKRQPVIYHLKPVHHVSLGICVDQRLARLVGSPWDGGIEPTVVLSGYCIAVKL